MSTSSDKFGKFFGSMGQGEAVTTSDGSTTLTAEKIVPPYFAKAWKRDEEDNIVREGGLPVMTDEDVDVINAMFNRQTREAGGRACQATPREDVPEHLQIVENYLISSTGRTITPFVGAIFARVKNTETNEIFMRQAPLSIIRASKVFWLNDEGELALMTLPDVMVSLCETSEERAALKKTLASKDGSKKIDVPRALMNNSFRTSQSGRHTVCTMEFNLSTGGGADRESLSISCHGTWFETDRQIQNALKGERCSDKAKAIVHFYKVLGCVVMEDILVAMGKTETRTPRDMFRLMRVILGEAYYGASPYSDPEKNSFRGYHALVAGVTDPARQGGSWADVDSDRLTEGLGVNSKGGDVVFSISPNR